MSKYFEGCMQAHVGGSCVPLMNNIFITEQNERYGRVNPIDVHVGKRLRIRRLQLSITQKKLAKLLGLTFQQVQKYEYGSNRISASRLFEIAKAVKVPISYFYEDFFVPQTNLADSVNPIIQNMIGKQKSAMEFGYENRETMELLRAYYRIQDPKKRHIILEFVRSAL